VSTPERRNQLREQGAKFAKSNANAARFFWRGQWAKSVTARTLWHLGASLMLVGVATLYLMAINGLVPLDLIPLLYMMPVVIAATRWGLMPGLIAAFASFAAADFFFYPPVYSFWFDNRQDVIDLLLYLLVAGVTSDLAARLHNEADTSNRRSREIAELHAFSQGLATCLDSRELIFAVQDYLSDTVGRSAFLIASESDSPNSAADGTAIPVEVRRQAASLAVGNRQSATTIVPHTQSAWLVRTIVPAILGYSAIAIELGVGSADNIRRIAKHVETVLDEATASFKHLKVMEAIEQATINFQTEVLRDALIGGVSHELRTPLASILGSCSVLDAMPAIRSDGNSHALIESIHDQAAQLDKAIRDLLDASRISAKGVRPQKMWTDPTDIIAAAVRQKQRRLAGNKVVLDVKRDVPLVYVDSALVEQALGQLLENAAKYSLTGSEIKVSTLCGEQYVDLAVTDEGCGLTEDEKRELGKRCYRSKRHVTGTDSSLVSSGPVSSDLTGSSLTGSGLGLWIASTFVAANGGSLWAESRGPNLGATVSLRLPTVSEALAEFSLDGLND
jgi:K+-sensing histidine kinase KdpD